MPHNHLPNPLTAAHADWLLDRMSAVRVLVVGDLMLDVYLRGAASRISPEAPVPVVRVEEQWRALGGAANVAANVAALGGHVTVLGCVGEDAAAAELCAELERQLIPTAGVLAVAGRRTTVKTRVLVRHHQVARYDSEDEQDVDAVVVARLTADLEAHAPAADVLVLADYDKGVLTPGVIRSALDLAAALTIPTVVDPKARRFFDYAGASIFKPNLAELGAALRTPVLPDDAGWMRRTREQLDCDALLLTLGEAGMALATRAGEYVRVPALTRAVYDVSGAGDTVCAAVALTLAAGGTPAQAALLANHAASIQVGKAGVATVTRDELRDVLREQETAGVLLR